MTTTSDTPVPTIGRIVWYGERIGGNVLEVPAMINEVTDDQISLTVFSPRGTYVLKGPLSVEEDRDVAAGRWRWPVRS